ncbi:MAG: hypothetical protein ACPG4K_02060 [Haloferula sp.]
MDLATIVEEADIGLSADGFDNFLMYDDGIEELQQYVMALNTIGASQTSKVIQDLLGWVTSIDGSDPLSVAESDTARADDLWRRYCAASEAEDPRKLSEEFDPRSEPKSRASLDGQRTIVTIDLKARIGETSTTAIWNSFERELGELNPSTRGAALKSKNTISTHLSEKYGSPIEIQFIGSDALASGSEVGKKAVAELKRCFSMMFKGVSPKILKVTWQD